MKDKAYQYAIYLVLTLTLGFSAFLITSDNLAPYTTQATMHRSVANIAPEVAGVITQVNINNGQKVKAGDVLFRIDNSSYLLSERQAEAELHQAQESHLAKWQELQAANHTLEQRTLEWHNAKTKFTRYQSLFSRGLITQQDFDDTQTNTKLAQSAVDAANAEILRIKAELTDKKQNAAIELAQVKLDKARLDLTNTDVISKTEGTVTNLQLQEGSFVSKGAVAMFLVNDNNSWLNADFNEKGIAHLTKGTPAVISFDALPGQVFAGTVMNIDRAIYDASNLNNQLASVTNDSHWIRQQQKIRTRIQVHNINPTLISGSKASVIVQNGSPLVDAIGYCWIKLVSYFRYIY